MRVLILPSWYPTPRNPVNGGFVREQAMALSKEHEVRVLYLDILPRGEKRRPRKGRRTKQGFAEHIVEVRNLPLVWQFNYLWTLLRALVRLRREFRPEVIHAHVAVPAGLGAALLGRLFSVPVVLTEHSGDFRPWRARPGLRLMATLAFSGADAVICVSESQERDLEAAFPSAGTPVVIPNSVDTGLFVPTPYPAADEAYRLLFVALLESEDKGLGYLLDALATVKEGGGPPLHLDVVGGGSLQRRYEARARDLGLSGSVTFHGTQPHSAVPGFMQRSHAFVLPSLHESQGVVAIEALASGRPVVAARSGGPESVVNESNGVLVAPGDAGQLAEGIVRVVSKPESYEPNTLASDAEVRFGRAAVVRRITEVYERVTLSGVS